LELLDNEESDVPDPIGSSLKVYEECRDTILKGLNQLCEFIEQQSK
jgi:protein-tyrosine-phosphatase